MRASALPLGLARAHFTPRCQSVEEEGRAEPGLEPKVVRQGGGKKTSSAGGSVQRQSGNKKGRG